MRLHSYKDEHAEGTFIIGFLIGLAICRVLYRDRAWELVAGKTEDPCVVPELNVVGILKFLLQRILCAHVIFSYKQDDF